MSPSPSIKGRSFLLSTRQQNAVSLPQYKELQDLYEKYQASGLEILDFPCNQFGGQAPGTMEEIRDFCTGKYHTTFPQFLKIDVNGPDADYASKPEVKWNFTKFLIDKEGKVVARFEPTASMEEVGKAVAEQL